MTEKEYRNIIDRADKLSDLVYGKAGRWPELGEMVIAIMLGDLISQGKATKGAKE